MRTNTEPMNSTNSARHVVRFVGALAAAVLLLASCGGAAADTPLDGAADADELPAAEELVGGDLSIVGPAEVSEPAVRTSTASTIAVVTGCEEIAALFTTGPSVNSDLADPESSAVCTDGSVVVSSNGIPDYTYIETSPGNPRANDYTFTIPSTPSVAAAPTDVPALGTAAISLTGIPIYGPTEGTGGDVLSLAGGLSECGSHNGPTGFHIHIIGTSANTDCLFTSAEVAAAPQLVGYAFDGFPIYTGNDQYTSSWELTDASLFATDTWSAHTYVAGSGDLDQCNGFTDANGNYAYYTTETFPYVIGCYTGVVDLDAAGGGGGGGQGPPR